MRTAYQSLGGEPIITYTVPWNGTVVGTNVFNKSANITEYLSARYRDANYTFTNLLPKGQYTFLLPIVSQSNASAGLDQNCFWILEDNSKIVFTNYQYKQGSNWVYTEILNTNKKLKGISLSLHNQAHNPYGYYMTNWGPSTLNYEGHYKY